MDRLTDRRVFFFFELLCSPSLTCLWCRILAAEFSRVPAWPSDKFCFFLGTLLFPPEGINRLVLTVSGFHEIKSNEVMQVNCVKSLQRPCCGCHWNPISTHCGWVPGPLVFHPQCVNAAGHSHGSEPSLLVRRSNAGISRPASPVVCLANSSKFVYAP